MRQPIPIEDVTEKEWQAQVCGLAKLLGWSHQYHTHDSRKSARGFPDVVFCRERLLFVEFKSEKGKLSEDQTAWANAIRAAGGEWHCWRPSDLDEVAAVLRKREARAA